MRVIALWTVKGGVGKTTAAVNLAHCAAGRGLRTLLWDLDPQGSASFSLRVRSRLKGGARALVRKGAGLEPLLRLTDYPNLELLPADFSNRNLDLELEARKQPRRRLAAKLEPLAARFDLALLDCPPSVSLVSEAVVYAADALLVPVVPSTLSLRSLDQVRTLAERRSDLPVLPFLSMVDRRRRLHREMSERFATGEAGFLRAQVPNSSLAERMGVERAPITATAPSSPVARAFAALWQEVADRMGL
jgi:chromosome partitioning protein